MPCHKDKIIDGYNTTTTATHSCGMTVIMDQAIMESSFFKNKIMEKFWGKRRERKFGLKFNLWGNDYD